MDQIQLIQRRQIKRQGKEEKRTGPTRFGPNAEKTKVSMRRERRRVSWS